MVGNLPIEVDENHRIIYDNYLNPRKKNEDGGVSSGINVKKLGLHANNTQHEDGWIKREFSRRFFEKYGYVPFNKHDEFRPLANHVKDAIRIMYEVKLDQFREKGMVKALLQVAESVNYDIEKDIPMGDLTLDDLVLDPNEKIKPHHLSFMMT